MKKDVRNIFLISLYNLLFFSEAHVPVFVDFGKCEIPDVIADSWAVYVVIPANGTERCTFNVANESMINISVSLPLLAYTDKENVQIASSELSVSLIAPNSSWTPLCRKGWTGWDTSEETKFTESFDKALNYTEVFEPWAVGAYVPVRACSTPAEEAGIYILEIINGGDADISISIGAGTVENIGEILLRGIYDFPMYNMLYWEAGNTWKSLSVYLWIEIIITWFLVCVIYDWFHRCDGNVPKFILVSSLILNGLQFLLRLIIVILNLQESYDENMWIPIVLHILFPMAIAILFTMLSGRYFVFTAFIFIPYMLLFLWGTTGLIGIVATVVLCFKYLI